MSKETSTDLASLAATYLGMTDEQLSDIPYPQLFDIIRQLAGSVLSQSELEIRELVEAPDPSRVSMETDNDHQPKDGD
jgi:hypothetical protein